MIAWEFQKAQKKKALAKDSTWTVNSAEYEDETEYRWMNIFSEN